MSDLVELGAFPNRIPMAIPAGRSLGAAPPEPKASTFDNDHYGGREQKYLVKRSRSASQ
jgi:hypothetical protein